MGIRFDAGGRTDVNLNNLELGAGVLLLGIAAGWSCAEHQTQPKPVPVTLSLSNPTGLVIHYYATAGPDTVMERWPIQYQHLFEAMPDIPGIVHHVEIGIGFPPQTVGVSWREDADSVVVEMMHRWEGEP